MLEPVPYFFLNSFLSHLLAVLLGVFIGWLIWARCCKRCEALHNALDREREAAEKTARELAETKRAAKVAASSTADSSAQYFSNDVSRGEGHVDETLGFLYAQKPENADDLTELKGVAEFLSSKLNAFGVYTFKQIALWKNSHIEGFSNLLDSYKELSDIRDRIQREEWVAQSKDLHFQKYGERL